MAKKKTDNIQIDDLVSDLVTDLGNRFKGTGYKPVYTLDDASADNVENFISTGSFVLDLAISNRRNGGVPVGRITEISGLEGSGKSLLCSHIIANTQKQGGIGVYIDTENSLYVDYLKAVGVDVSKMIYSKVRPIEMILEGIEHTIENVRSKDKNIPLTIILDSYAGASSKSKENSNFDRTGYNTDKSLIMSDHLGKIADLIGNENVTLVVTNQLRENMNAMPFAEKYRTPGGKALPFFSSVRLRAKSTTKLKGKRYGVEEVVGIQTVITVFKNRLGPSNRDVTFDIYYDSGINDYSGVFNLAKKYKVFTAGGGWTYYKDSQDNEHKFNGQTDFQTQMIENPELFEKIKDTLSDKYIMSYTNQKTSVNLDEVELGETVREDD